MHELEQRVDRNTRKFLLLGLQAPDRLQVEATVVIAVVTAAAAASSAVCHWRQPVTPATYSSL